ncbi:hypothetical protein SEQ_HALENA_1 [Mycobacterium phage Halena]|uniref:Uncharacterized protein n=4 Tax=Bronvirus TaxID=1623278 RepID=A0A482JAV8_9CAUD|nr:hypothetical protein KNU48_gp001 [Mycobacterium phage Silverleaf]AYD82183.1 hypothetical protein SEA_WAMBURGRXPRESS_1 [Mycobacterium phage Wamburgrxpress]AZS12155.1 hypothetical protein SEA_ACQUIRE49_1 [Mycobacterium phage Acquire49]QBP29785.1 hypothetical protein SEQ_HALENA_1 [Mycobacterium phage Halena]QDK04007.1 hypothetical protein SEA_AVADAKEDAVRA_1 [Mycobacterium phage AvadaKedavra]QGJ92407.1 hypothetical protein SEA_WYATT2_1 [Mycobacterium phage Wyatt2]QGJ93022.1 hypothetical protei
MGRGRGKDPSSPGGRSRDSRPSTQSAWEAKVAAKPKNAQEYTVKVAEDLGWEVEKPNVWTNQGMHAAGIETLTMRKGDAYVYATFTWPNGRIRTVDVRVNGFHEDMFGSERKDKRKAMKEILEKYGK